MGNTEPAGKSPEFLRITEENIDREHICCAMSNAQSLVKKEWLKERFPEGLVFYRSRERGKCFIEYIPAEYAWAPIEAEGYLYIDCLWISGILKNRGYSRTLLNECIRDAKAQNRCGLCMLSSAGKKKEFLSDSRFLEHMGFEPADRSECGINLMALRFDKNAPLPQFRECAKSPKADGPGFVLYYTDQCPFTAGWVEKVRRAAQEHGIPLKIVHITDRAGAQTAPTPWTTYTLFRDGVFVTHAVLTDKKFLTLAGVAP